MQSVLRMVLLAVSLAALGGCYVAAPGPGPVYGRPYAAGVFVPGHFGPNGFWIPGHYR
jgi:hypothetical protein